MRDVGKALGLSTDVTARLAGTVWGSYGGAIVDQQIAEAGLDPANPAHKEIMALQRASKFIPTKAENYKGIETAAQAAGLLK